MKLIGFLVIGAAAGWVAGKLMKGHGFGLVGNLIVGLIGSLIGGFCFGLLGLSAYGVVGAFTSASAGAVVLLFLVGFLKKV